MTLDDPPQKIGFVYDKWFMVEGGQGLAEVGESAVYLAIPVRNVGSGIAVLHGWTFFGAERLGSDLPEHRDPDEFTGLARDLYIPVGDVGFWQGAFRDPGADEFAQAAATRASGGAASRCRPPRSPSLSRGRECVTGRSTSQGSARR